MKTIILIILCSILISCNTLSHMKSNWKNSISNPANEEFIQEVAFNLNIKAKNVTQQQFNTRYYETILCNIEK